MSLTNDRLETTSNMTFEVIGKGHSQTRKQAQQNPRIPNQRPNNDTHNGDEHDDRKDKDKSEEGLIVTMVACGFDGGDNSMVQSSDRHDRAWLYPLRPSIRTGAEERGIAFLRVHASSHCEYLVLRLHPSWLSQQLCKFDEHTRECCDVPVSAWATFHTAVLVLVVCTLHHSHAYTYTYTHSLTHSITH